MKTEMALDIKDVSLPTGDYGLAGRSHLMPNTRTVNTQGT